MFWFTLLLLQAAVAAQIERGETLFFDSTKGCASCHALKRRGTAGGHGSAVPASCHETG
jgi:cytochrome c551/c552